MVPFLSVDRLGVGDEGEPGNRRVVVYRVGSLQSKPRFCSSSVSMVELGLPVAAMELLRWRVKALPGDDGGSCISLGEVFARLVCLSFVAKGERIPYVPFVARLVRVAVVNRRELVFQLAV